MESEKKKSKGLVHIGKVLENTLITFQKETASDIIKIWDIWEKEVGVSIAQNARPAAFREKLLLVNVSSSVWLQELQFFKGDMIKKINAALGKDLIEEIRFKVGPII